MPTMEYEDFKKIEDLNREIARLLRFGNYECDSIKVVQWSTRIHDELSETCRYKSVIKAAQEEAINIAKKLQQEVDELKEKKEEKKTNWIAINTLVALLAICAMTIIGIIFT